MSIQYLDNPQSGSTIQYLDNGDSTPLSSIKNAVKDSLVTVPLAIGKAIGSPITDPIGTFRKNQNYLPAEGAVLGTAIAPGLGTAIGAGGGQILRNMGQIEEGDPNAPTTPLDAAKSAMIQSGVNAIPESSLIEGMPSLGEQAISGMSKIGNSIAKGMSKFGSVLSGAKPQDLMQAYDQGLSTYLAPSVSKAGDIFENTATAEGINTDLPTDVVYSPRLTEARQMATDIVSKMKSGADISAQEALQGKQAIQYVIDSTPSKAKGIISQMVDDRDALDSILAQKSSPMKGASDIYRQSKVKSNLLSPLRINKSGEMGAMEPILAMLATAGTHSPLPVLGALGTSPLAVGAGASLAGSMGDLVRNLMVNPATRQAFIGAIANHLTNEANGQQQPQQ